MSMDPPGIECSVSTGPYPSTAINCERSTLTLLSFRYRRLRCSLVLVSAAARFVALSVDMSVYVSIRDRSSLARIMREGVDSGRRHKGLRVVQT